MQNLHVLLHDSAFNTNFEKKKSAKPNNLVKYLHLAGCGMVSSVETVLHIKKKKRRKKENLSPQLPALILFAPPRALKRTPPHRLPEMSSLVSRKHRIVPSPRQGSRVPGVPSAFAWVPVPPRHRSRSLEVGQMPGERQHVGTCAGELGRAVSPP